MNFRKSLFVAVMLIGALVLVACGGDGGNGNTGPTGGSTTLTQTITADDGSSVQYPEGWVAEAENSTFAIASDAEILNMAGSGEQPDAIESGQVYVSVSVIPSAGMEGMSMTDIAGLFASEGMPGEPTELTIGGHEALSVSGTSDMVEGVSAGSYFVLVNNTTTNNLIMAIGITAPGEEGNIADTVNAIAASVQPASAGS